MIGFLAMSLSALGEAAAEEGLRRVPETRVEAFLLDKDSVSVKSFRELGLVRGRNGGSLTVGVVRVFNVDNGRVARGVSIRVENAEHEVETAYVDEKELPDLLDGLEYLTEFGLEYRPTDQVETKVETLGSFLFLRSSAPGEVEFLAMAGRVPSAAILLNQFGALDLQDLLVDAQETMERMR
ncbi:hypothetical protein LBMAG42_37510 [Deltaproteobacteria bacterium]|nr:hypothetical protein LBMAG42_37510 [Deltaproteobacteria bacterium]